MYKLIEHVRHNHLSFVEIYNCISFLYSQGLTCPATADPTLGLLSKLTNLTSVAIVDPAPASGLSLNVIALLPKLILNFDEPDEFCKEAANNIHLV